MNNGRKAAQDLLAEAELAIEQSFTFAKAAGPEGEDDSGSLDDDFKDFDQAKGASDEAEQGREDESEDEDQGEGEQDSGEDGEDEGSEDGEGDKPNPFAKADAAGVDAWPLLEALDRKLALLPEMAARLDALETQNATLAKAVQEGARGNFAMAKAVAAGLNVPLTPKSKQARQVAVPIAQAQASKHTPAQVMAKADAALMADRLTVDDISIFNTLVNQGGLDFALSNSPAVARIVAEKE